MVPEDSSATAETFSPSFHKKEQKNIAQIRATRLFFLFLFFLFVGGASGRYCEACDGFLFLEAKETKEEMEWEFEISKERTLAEDRGKVVCFGLLLVSLLLLLLLLLRLLCSVGFHWFVTFGSEVFALHCVGKWSNIFYFLTIFFQKWWGHRDDQTTLVAV